MTSATSNRYLSDERRASISRRESRPEAYEEDDVAGENRERAKSPKAKPRRSTKLRLGFQPYFDGNEIDAAICNYNNINLQLRMMQRYTTKNIVDLSGYNNRLSYAEQTITNLIIKQQTKDHMNERIYSDIIRKNLKGFTTRLAELMKNGEKIDNIRDTAGATLCHIAYVYESFEIGRWLVSNYPELGLETYSSKFETFGEESVSCGVNMPYSNENILHIIIVKRNHNETRWILDFYRDHKDSVPFGLEKLLTTFVSGSFFRRDGPFYFGGYPLHFAVCTNDIEMFDLILSYASTCTIYHPTINSSDTNKIITDNDITNEFDDNNNNNDDDNNNISIDKRDIIKYRSLLGRNALFTRDIHGNTILHLCVLHNLLHMYRHVKETAQRLVKKELTNAFAEYIESIDEKNRSFGYKSVRFSASYNLKDAHHDAHGDGHDNAHDDVYDVDDYPYIMLEALIYEDNYPVPADGRSKIYLPTMPDTHTVDRNFNEEWLYNATDDILKDRFYLALNEDYLSPLTLAALGNGRKGTQPEEEKKKATIEFLLQEFKTVKWVYGPIRTSILELEGLETPFNRYRYNQPDKVKLYSRTAIDILSRLDCDKSIAIDDIKKIINTKWQRCGYPSFKFYAIISMLLTIVITFILCLINHTPTTFDKWSNISISAVTILYPIASCLLMILAYNEVPAIWKYRLDYWGFYGGIRGAARFDKYARSLMTWSFIALCISKAIISYQNQANQYHDPSSSSYHVQDYRSIRFSLTICVMSCYIYMYYFLMGFDTSGPFVLTIYRIISKNIPYFLQFYIVILVSFGCALSLVTNNGNPSFAYGFWHLGLVIWTLVRSTVNLDPSNSELSEDNISEDTRWLFDLLITSYSILVVIIFLNLLIALISDTYSSIRSYDESLLLIEKYNILSAMERNLNPDQRDLLRRLYTSAIDDNNRTAVKSVDDQYKKRYAFESYDTNPAWLSDNAAKTMVSVDHKNTEKVILLIIDPQNDFHGDVMRATHATEVSHKIARYIRDNQDNIDEIFVSMDSRYRYNITNSIFWRAVDEDGQETDEKPAPYTVIRNVDIAKYQDKTGHYLKGKWKPAKESMLRWCSYYTEELERRSRSPLTIWPEHCIVGTRGHAVTPVVNEALQAWVRHTHKTVSYVSRGHSYRTEMHSIFRADIEDPNDRTTLINSDLLLKLKLADKLLICGHHYTHNINKTLRDLMKHWTKDMSKIELIRDAVSYLPQYENMIEECDKFVKISGITVKNIDID